MVDPEVIWACTTCRWCERACPLDISYVDKLVEQRRNLVLEKAEFPEEAQPAFRGYEVNGNPWQLPAEERGDWAKGLDVPLAAEAGGDFEYLFFVGSPGSYDDHGKKVSQALARILKAAGVKFAILGPEEVSTGDAARRLGNEYLFQMLAMQNIESHERLRCQEDRHQLPARLQHLEARVPRLRRQLRGRPRHPAGGRAGACRAGSS